MACPAGFLLFNASCYQRTLKATTHLGCVEACGEMNASLACVTSSAESDYLSAVLDNHSWPFLERLGSVQTELAAVWTGHYRSVNGWSECASGERSFNYSDFSTNPWDGSDCTVLQTAPTLGPLRIWRWQSRRCWENANCLCERDAFSERIAPGRPLTPAYLTFATVDQVESRENLRWRVQRMVIILYGLIFPGISAAVYLMWLLCSLLSRLRFTSTSVVTSHTTEAVALSSTTASAPTSAPDSAPGRATTEDATVVALQAAESAAARMRRRIALFSVGIGWTGLALSLSGAIFIFVSAYAFGLSFFDSWQLAVGSWAVPILQIVLFPWAVAFASIALRPVDGPEIRRASTLLLTSLGAMGSLLLFSVASRKGSDPLIQALDVAISISFLFHAAILYPASICSPSWLLALAPRRQLMRFWQAWRSVSLTMSLYFFLTMLVRLERDKPTGIIYRGRSAQAQANFVLYYTSVVISYLLAGLVFTRSARGRILRWLGSVKRGGDSKEQEAACVAALVSIRATSASAAFLSARRLFRGLPLTALHRSIFFKQGAQRAFAHGQVSPKELAAQAVPAELGKVAAFVSYSWSDDDDAQYDALEAWVQDQWSLSTGSTKPVGEMIWIVREHSRSWDDKEASCLTPA